MSAEGRSWRWRVALAWWLGPALLGLGAGLVAAPSQGVSYLALQSSSDRAHRFAAAVLPICLVGMLLAWVTSRAGKRFGWIRQPAQLISACSLAGLVGTLTFVARFDSAIEDKGFQGQFVLAKAPSAVKKSADLVLGPFTEEDRVAGVVTPELPGGGRLTLDRLGLARKTPEGEVRWVRPRPGRSPGSVLVASDTAFFAGLGLVYEDDVVVFAVDLDSGHWRWTFHCLGNALAPSIDGPDLCLVARRPSSASVYLLRWREPKVVWTVFLEGTVPLPPRFTPRGVEVAIGGELLLLDRATGRTLERKPACGQPGDRGVVCRQGRITAWTNGANR